MKLQKRFLRKYKEKDYFKFMVNLSPEIIKQAKLKESDELEAEVDGGVIKIKKKV